MVKVLKRFYYALEGVQLGPKRGQNEVLGYFHVENALVFANVAYYDRELRFLFIDGDGGSEHRFSSH